MHMSPSGYRTKKISAAEARRIIASRGVRIGGMLHSQPIGFGPGGFSAPPALEDAATMKRRLQRAAARRREIEIARARLRS